MNVLASIEFRTIFIRDMLASFIIKNAPED